MTQLNYDIFETILSLCDIQTIYNFKIAYPEYEKLCIYNLRKIHGVSQFNYLKIQKKKALEEYNKLISSNYMIYCSCGKNINSNKYIAHCDSEYHKKNMKNTPSFYNPTEYELLKDIYNPPFNDAKLVYNIKHKKWQEYEKKHINKILCICHLSEDDLLKSYGRVYYMDDNKAHYYIWLKFKNISKYHKIYNSYNEENIMYDLLLNEGYKLIFENDDDVFSIRLNYKQINK